VLVEVVFEEHWEEDELDVECDCDEDDDDGFEEEVDAFDEEEEDGLEDEVEPLVELEDAACFFIKKSESALVEWRIVIPKRMMVKIIVGFMAAV
jgi:hypothetical protein